MRQWQLIGLLVAALLVAVACGSQSPPEQQRQERGGTTEADSSNDLAVSSIGDVKDAMVYIEARGGPFNEQMRGFGEINYGSGSGFIIDPSGLTVTNNHVVTGSGFLQVYLEGEEDPIDARILGSSECSDLSLIKLDGDSYPYLEWSTEDIDAALDVRAAGYPADDISDPEERPDYTITSGSINSIEAEGETPWASVDSVIEHDVLIRPGSSGGPLLDENGGVVGVNFASRLDENGTPTGQQFAIAREEAQEIINELRGGDVEFIGINGEAVTDEEAQFSGIDVVSVKTGSPAGKVGIKNAVIDPESGEKIAGDIVTKLEGTRLGENGTLEEYCNILRQHDPDDPLSIEVVRVEEGGDVVRLEGTLNGDKLQEVERIESDTGSGDAESGDAEADDGYTVVSDDSGALTVEVPSEWTDVSGGSWAQDNVLDGRELGPQITASTDIDGFIDTWNTPGVFFGASRLLVEEYPENTVDQILDSEFVDFSDACEYDARYEYDDGTYVGKEDVWINCGDTDAEQRNIVALPEDGSFAVLVQHTIVNDSDFDVARHINETFNVEGDL